MARLGDVLFSCSILYLRAHVICSIYITVPLYITRYKPVPVNKMLGKVSRKIMQRNHLAVD